MHDLGSALAESHAEAEALHLVEVAGEVDLLAREARAQQGDVLAGPGERPVAVGHAVPAGRDDGRRDADAEHDVAVGVERLQRGPGHRHHHRACAAGGPAPRCRARATGRRRRRRRAARRPRVRWSRPSSTTSSRPPRPARAVWSAVSGPRLMRLAKVTPARSMPMRPTLIRACAGFDAATVAGHGRARCGHGGRRRVGGRRRALHGADQPRLGDLGAQRRLPGGHRAASACTPVECVPRASRCSSAGASSRWTSRSARCGTRRADCVHVVARQGGDDISRPPLRARPAVVAGRRSEAAGALEQVGAAGAVGADRRHRAVRVRASEKRQSGSPRVTLAGMPSALVVSSSTSSPSSTSRRTVMPCRGGDGHGEAPVAEELVAVADRHRERVDVVARHDRAADRARRPPGSRRRRRSPSSAASHPLAASSS